MISADDLAIGYGAVPVVHGVSFSLSQSEAVAIVGRNGVGKSTLTKGLMGVLPAQCGRVFLSGVDITRMPTEGRVRRGIGYVAQGSTVFPTLSVLENVMVAVDTRSRRVAQRQAAELLEEEFPLLADRFDQRADTLSGGQRRVLELARCLVRNPSILILDEPTEGIQPSLVDALLAKLIELRTSRDLTLLLVEQRLDFAAAAADRCLVMVKGAFVAETAPQELLSNIALQHEYLGV